MRILISNDDGYLASGIKALEASLLDFAEVMVVAPEADRSGAGHSLTLDRPLSAHRVDETHYYVNGTPVDCVYLAISELLPWRPDLVISGINLGANLGDDTLYSGTVAAAMEAFMAGIPAIAISLVTAGDARHLETAVRVARYLAEQQRDRIAQGAVPMLWNVNVPDIPYADVKGLQWSRLGRRRKSHPVIHMQSPRGKPIYWIGPAGGAEDAAIGTDFSALLNHAVSVTPLLMDLTHVSQWQEGKHSCGLCLPSA